MGLGGIQGRKESKEDAVGAKFEIVTLRATEKNAEEYRREYRGTQRRRRVRRARRKGCRITEKLSEYFTFVNQIVTQGATEKNAEEYRRKYRDAECAEKTLSECFPNMVKN